jgi:hypothetical protein
MKSIVSTDAEDGRILESWSMSTTISRRDQKGSDAPKLTPLSVRAHHEKNDRVIKNPQAKSDRNVCSDPSLLCSNSSRAPRLKAALNVWFWPEDLSIQTMGGRLAISISTALALLGRPGA